MGSCPWGLSAVTVCWVTVCVDDPCLAPTVVLAFGCEDMGVVFIMGLWGAVLVCGVLIRGDTYDLGEEASDVRDMGD